jgi:tRNA threonylcarbamoyladenosine biosynthesis protein TsaE
MRFISHSVEDTLRFGRMLARRLHKGDVIALSGELGSGKTVLTKGIAAGLGIRESRLISPTFVLFRIYDAKKLSLYHFDFYRLSCAGDIAGIGYEEYFFGDGVTVIEWPERLGPLMPAEHLRIGLTIVGQTGRALTLTARGPSYCELARKLDEDTRH